MTDNSLMMDILKEMREALRRVEDRLDQHTLELHAIRMQDGAWSADTQSTTAAIGDLQDRMKRIERRLNLTE